MLEPLRERAIVQSAVSPEALWPLVSDTNRLNEASGLGEVHVRPNPDGGLPRQLVTAKFGPLTLEWAELPFEWSAPHRLAVRREVTKGLVARIDFELTLAAEGGGTQVQVQVSLTPRHRSAQPIAAVAARVVSKKLADGVRALAAEAGGKPRRADVPTVQRRALDAAIERLEAEAPPPVRALAPRLRARIAEAPDHEVARIRPYELAEAWQVPRRRVLELCLHGAVAGVLDLSWDVVCPSCRTAAVQLPELGGLEESGHCDLCDLGFGVEMDRAVEASFKPAPGVRAVDAPVFCTGGPGATPHVVAQINLEPGAPGALAVPAEPGRYRLFVRGGGMGTVEVVAGGPDEAPVAISETPEPAHVSVAPAGRLRLELDGVDARHVKLEHLHWASRAATAYEVTTVPAFRRYFGRESLKPGLGLEVRRASLLFSDLSASTALYAREGDAAAFRLVQDHFDLVEDCIHRFDGAIVKTIGDAVMASFVDERSALAAALAAQAAFPAFRAAHAASDGVFLKIGVFSGPCFAVTANGALDFFGQTVNVAARLQGQAGDGETVATAQMMGDLGEDPMLAKVTRSAPFVPRLKGVEQAIEVVRLRVDTE